MSAWLRHHAHSLAATIRRLLRTPATTLLSVLAIGVALALPLGAWVLVDGAQRLGPRLPGEPQLSVFLAADATGEDAARVAAALAKAPSVRRHRIVSKETALAELQRVEGMREILATLGSNPLPDAVVAELASSDPESGRSLAAQLRQLPKVEIVQFDALWIRRLDGLLRLGVAATAVLAVLLGVGMVAIMFSTIRQQVLTQQAEVEVSRLIGATDAFIRRPFVYQGAVLGVAGGLTALAIVAGTLHYLNGEVGRLAATYGSDFRLSVPPAADLGALLALAGVLGWAGAFISVSEHLRRLRRPS
jgi:cell division transport system permease protein